MSDDAGSAPRAAPAERRRLLPEPREIGERAFKRLVFWTTFAGLVVMAVGLQALVFERAFLRFLALFLAGGALATLPALVYRPRAAPGFTVELYTREGCSLCEEARAWLDAKAREYDFSVWEIDVDEDAALAERYGDHVPVGVLDGKEELFRLRADYAALDRRFRKLADARVRGR